MKIGPLSGNPKDHAIRNAPFVGDYNLYLNKVHYWNDLGLTFYVKKKRKDRGKKNGRQQRRGSDKGTG